MVSGGLPDGGSSSSLDPTLESMMSSYASIYGREAAVARFGAAEMARMDAYGKAVQASKGTPESGPISIVGQKPLATSAFDQAMRNPLRQAQTRFEVERSISDERAKYVERESALRTPEAQSYLASQQQSWADPRVEAAARYARANQPPSQTLYTKAAPVYSNDPSYTPLSQQTANALQNQRVMAAFQTPNTPQVFGPPSPPRTLQSYTPPQRPSISASTVLGSGYGRTPQQQLALDNAVRLDQDNAAVGAGVSRGYGYKQTGINYRGATATSQVLSAIAAENAGKKYTPQGSTPAYVYKRFGGLNDAQRAATSGSTMPEVKTVSIKETSRLYAPEPSGGPLQRTADSIFGVGPTFSQDQRPTYASQQVEVVPAPATFTPGQPRRTQADAILDSLTGVPTQAAPLVPTSGGRTTVSAPLVTSGGEPLGKPIVVSTTQGNKVVGYEKTYLPKISDYDAMDVFKKQEVSLPSNAPAASFTPIQTKTEIIIPKDERYVASATQLFQETGKPIRVISDNKNEPATVIKPDEGEYPSVVSDLLTRQVGSVYIPTSGVTASIGPRDLRRGFWVSSGNDKLINTYKEGGRLTPADSMRAAGEPHKELEARGIPLYEDVTPVVQQVGSSIVSIPDRYVASSFIAGQTRPRTGIIDETADFLQRVPTGIAQTVPFVGQPISNVMINTFGLDPTDISTGATISMGAAASEGAQLIAFPKLLEAGQYALAKTLAKGEASGLATQKLAGTIGSGVFFGWTGLDALMMTGSKTSTGETLTLPRSIVRSATGVLTTLGLLGGAQEGSQRIRSVSNQIFYGETRPAMQAFNNPFYTQVQIGEAKKGLTGGVQFEYSKSLTDPTNLLKNEVPSKPLVNEPAKISEPQNRRQDMSSEEITIEKSMAARERDRAVEQSGKRMRDEIGDKGTIWLSADVNAPGATKSQSSIRPANEANQARIKEIDAAYDARIAELDKIAAQQSYAPTPKGSTPAKPSPIEYNFQPGKLGEVAAEVSGVAATSESILRVWPEEYRSKNPEVAPQFLQRMSSGALTEISKAPLEATRILSDHYGPNAGRLNSLYLDSTGLPTGKKAVRYSATVSDPSAVRKIASGEYTGVSIEAAEDVLIRKAIERGVPPSDANPLQVLDSKKIGSALLKDELPPAKISLYSEQAGYDVSNMRLDVQRQGTYPLSNIALVKTPGFESARFERVKINVPLGKTEPLMFKPLETLTTRFKRVAAPNSVPIEYSLETGRIGERTIEVSGVAATGASTIVPKLVRYKGAKDLRLQYYAERFDKDVLNMIGNKAPKTVALRLSHGDTRLGFLPMGEFTSLSLRTTPFGEIPIYSAKVTNPIAIAGIERGKIVGVSVNPSGKYEAHISKEPRIIVDELGREAVSKENKKAYGPIDYPIGYSTIAKEGLQNFVPKKVANRQIIVTKTSGQSELPEISLTGQPAFGQSTYFEKVKVTVPLGSEVIVPKRVSPTQPSTAAPIVEAFGIPFKNILTITRPDVGVSSVGSFMVGKMRVKPMQIFGGVPESFISAARGKGGIDIGFFGKVKGLQRYNVAETLTPEYGTSKAPDVVKSIIKYYRPQDLPLLEAGKISGKIGQMGYRRQVTESIETAAKGSRVEPYTQDILSAAGETSAFAVKGSLSSKAQKSLARPAGDADVILFGATVRERYGIGDLAMDRFSNLAAERVNARAKQLGRNEKATSAEGMVTLKAKGKEADTLVDPHSFMYEVEAQKRKLEQGRDVFGVPSTFTTDSTGRMYSSESMNLVEKGSAISNIERVKQGKQPKDLGDLAYKFWQASEEPYRGRNVWEKGGKQGVYEPKIKTQAEKGLEILRERSGMKSEEFRRLLKEGVNPFDMKPLEPIPTAKPRLLPSMFAPYGRASGASYGSTGRYGFGSAGSKSDSKSPSSPSSPFSPSSPSPSERPSGGSSPPPSGPSGGSPSGSSSSSYSSGGSSSSSGSYSYSYSYTEAPFKSRPVIPFFPASFPGGDRGGGPGYGTQKFQSGMLFSVLGFPRRR